MLGMLFGAQYTCPFRMATLTLAHLHSRYLHQHHPLVLTAKHSIGSPPLESSKCVSLLAMQVCNHRFHNECLQRWGDLKCPVCRYCAQASSTTSHCSVCNTSQVACAAACMVIVLVLLQCLLQSASCLTKPKVLLQHNDICQKGDVACVFAFRTLFHDAANVL